jgi:pimeloyl-ACP methyl ester carboxylesterase
MSPATTPDPAPVGGVTIQRIPVNGTIVNVATAGAGPALLLLHGWPHTWQVWSHVMAALAVDHRVIAPDLRGMGGSDRTVEGHDAATLAADAAALLVALGEPSAGVVALDAGVPVAFLLAMSRPEMVDRLVVMEGLLPGLPGAEALLSAGPPWWFGFHSVPGLAETVLVGHEGEYLDWFLTSGTLGRGVDPAIRDVFVDAYTGGEALRAGFELYRAGTVNAGLVRDAVTSNRLRMPTMAIGAATTGGALARQLEPVADDLVAHVMADCGHIIPLDRPAALLDLLAPFLGS